MQLITPTLLESLANEQKRKMQELLPELIRRLIIASCPGYSYLRIPYGDNIYEPGFDGIVVTESATPFVSRGQSVWEFGTSSRISQKINKDFRKRTTSPQGIDQKETTFYLVTPKTWHGSVSIPEWESQHRGIWKQARLYDAVILCDWINSEPQVCAWLLEEFYDKRILEFSTVAAAWGRFSSLTSPAFSHTLFTIGREKIIGEYLDQVRKQNCFVQADTFYDALGFCLSALTQDPEAANDAIVVYNEQSYLSLTAEYQGKTFLLYFPFRSQVSASNHTILCYSREATWRRGMIRLRALCPSQFEKALLDMGIKEPKPRELYAFSHGNLLSLIRRIPGNSADSTPAWASSVGSEFLYPLIFLRQYNFMSDTGQRVVSMLSGMDEMAVRQKYQDFLRLEDSPVKRVDDWFVIINYEEAWLTLQVDLSDAASTRLFHTIINLLEENKSKHSNGASDTAPVIRSLLFNYIYFSEYGSSEILLRKQINEFLSYLQFPGCQAIILGSLPDLAEASPDSVISFLESLLLPENQPMWEQLSSSRQAHSIVWALDRLVRVSQSAISACRLLIRLINNKGLDSSGTSPTKTLLDTLCLWDDRTPLTIQEKASFVKDQILEAPSFGIPFALDLLSKRTITRGVRLGEKSITYPPVTIQEYNEASQEIASCVLTHAILQKNLEWIERIFDSYWLLPCDNLSAAILEFDPNDYSGIQLARFVLNLQRHIFHIQKYHRDDRQRWIVPLTAWVDRIISNDPMMKAAWMFTVYSDAPFPCVLACEATDYHLRDSLVQETRISAFKELQKNIGLLSALQVTQFMEDHHAWGEFLANCLLADEMEHAVAIIAQQKKYQLLSGLLDTLPLAPAENLFLSLSESEKREVVTGLTRSDIINWLDSSDLQRLYWQGKHLYTLDNWAYQNLLKYNPGGILPFLYQRAIQQTGIDEMLLEVFRAIADSESLVDEAMLRTVIQKVDACHYSDPWAEICIQLVNKKVLELRSIDGYYPECVKTFFFLHPEKMIESCKYNEPIVSCTYQLPAAAFSDYEKFRKWSDTLYESLQDTPYLLNVISDAFAQSPNGADIIYPHEYVRQALEDYSDDLLTKEVAISHLNRRGARIVQDGFIETRKAEELRESARRMELKYPHTAWILRYLANSYASEAERDLHYAEMGRLI